MWLIQPGIKGFGGCNQPSQTYGEDHHDGVGLPAVLRGRRQGKQVETRVVQTAYEEKLLPHEDSPAVVAQRGCVVPVLGGFQDQTEP